MAEYTYKDVIIDPEDPRVEVGKEYYAATSISSALRAANAGNESLLVNLDSVNREPTRTLITSKPFTVSYKHGNGGDTDFIIRKKEPEKKYVPFDLSLKEDRDRLKGEWVRKKDNSEIKLIWWLWEMDGKWMIDEDISPQELLDNWVFDFESLPCGKLVEETV